MSGGQGSMHLNNRGSGYQTSQPQSSTPTPTPAPFSMHMPTTLSTIGMGVAQQQHYPGINSIPGMHSMSHMGGIQGMQTLQGMPGMQSFSNMPGIPAMQSLLHPPQDTTTQSLSSSHLSNQYASSGILSGGVDKRRKNPRKQRNPHINFAVLSGEDPHAMMMAAQHAAQQQTTHPDATTAVQQHSMPVFEADGIQFKILEQLPDTKIQRLRSEKIKPIESLTFNDIKAYNRNQLRAYCSVYGIRRKKKAEMERDMARYAALFHPNDPAYDINKFEPTEYADGPIPRRKVPVTKEQKEQAAGDMKRLTNALQQRPQASTLGAHHFQSTASNGHHHALTSGHSLHHTPIAAAPRLHDIHGTQHHTTAQTTHHGVGGHHGQHGDEHEQVVVGSHDLMSVPEMVPNHLLGISHQIGEE